jgi:hypothetical protein
MNDINAVATGDALEVAVSTRADIIAGMAPVRAAGP